MKRMRASLLFVLCVATLPTIAQRLSGMVTDTQGKTIPGIAVMLINVTDTSKQWLTASGTDGHFVFIGLAAGNYELRCFGIGFGPFSGLAVTLPTGSFDRILPPVILKPAMANTLKEVAIIARKPLIEQRTDRTVVNVDAMISAAGGSALEALGKSPGIYVDQNGNIELNGQGRVLVLIDGKQTYLSAPDLAAYLKSVPFAMLDKIELMSNPPANYDASGSAVINLVLKKNQSAGFNGNLNVAYAQGFYSRINDTLNVNYREKSFNVFANASFTRDANYTNDNGSRDLYNSNGTLNAVILLNSHYAAYTTGIWNFRTGMDYFVSTNTTIGFVLTGSSRPKTDILDYSGTQYNMAMQPDSVSKGYTSGKYNWQSRGANLNLLHKMDDKGQQLSADLDYIRYRSDGSQLSPSNFYSNEGSLSSSSVILNQTPSAIDIYAGKVDYMLPLGAKAALDAGLKSSLVNTDNENNWFDQSGNGFVPDFTNTNHFIYKENINAAYLSAKKEWQRWGIQAGVRMENTNASGHQLGNVAVRDSSFTKGYTNVFPGLFVSHKLDSMGNNTLVFSYSVRVLRPNYYQLDPFLFYKNPYTYSAGNPYLNPDYNHILQLKYFYKQYFGLTVAYFHVSNDIYPVTQNSNGVFTTRPQNFGINNSINLSAFANFTPLSWWDLNANLLVFNLTNKGNAFGQVIDDNHTTGEIELSNSFTFGHDWSAELDYAYHGPGYGAQNTTASIWTSSAGIQKKIFKGNGTIRLKVNDIFHSLQSSQTLVTEGATYMQTTISDTRLIGLSINFRFGKDANARKRDDKGSAEDEQGRVK